MWKQEHDRTQQKVILVAGQSSRERRFAVGWEAFTAALVVREYLSKPNHHEVMPQLNTLAAGASAIVAGVLALGYNIQPDLYIGAFFLILGIVLVASGFSSPAT